MSPTPSSLGLGHKTERKATVTVSPAWTVDLRTVGFTGFEPKHETWGINLRPTHLCFSDGKTLVATFMTREDVKTLARRDNADAENVRPDRLHGIFLDAQTGKVQAAKEWSVPRPRGGIIPAGDGRFVVLTPAMVALYSPSLDLLKELKLSPEQQLLLWDFHFSPTGKSILVEYHHPEATYQWLDSDSLQPQGASWRDSRPVLSISDDKEIASFRATSIKSVGFKFEATIQPRDGPGRTLCRHLNGQGESCGEPKFLSNDVVAFWQPHGFYLVPKAGGNVFLRAEFPDDEWVGRFYSSADGKRFAVSVWAYKGGSALFDISPRGVLKRIEVYDIASRQRVYNFDAKKQKVKIKDLSGVALSPDGSLLAILTNGVVDVYQISSA